MKMLLIAFTIIWSSAASAIDFPKDSEPTFTHTEPNLQVTLAITDQLDALSDFSANTKIPVIKETERNKTVYAFLVISLPNSNGERSCDLTTVFTTKNPKGEVTYHGKELSAWKGSVPEGGGTKVSDEVLTLRFDESDLLGSYEVSAVLKDMKTSKTYELTYPLELTK